MRIDQAIEALRSQATSAEEAVFEAEEEISALYDIVSTKSRRAAELKKQAEALEQRAGDPDWAELFECRTDRRQVAMFDVLQIPGRPPASEFKLR